MLSPEHRPAVMGFYFYPRGGSAQVARYLARALDDGPWAPIVVAGSLGGPGEPSHAGQFFAPTRCVSVDYTPAHQRWAQGGDPMAELVPLHGSFEDKPGVPDRVVLDLDDAAYELQVASWVRHFAAGTTTEPSLLHLHHLTPMHAAAGALWPSVPIVTHLHGTELKMLAQIRDGSLANCPGRFADAWVHRMRHWAAMSARLVVVSAMDHQLALELLPVHESRVVTIANGVDTEVFSRVRHSPAERMQRWRRWLVDDPKGWRPGEGEGSVRYSSDDLTALTDDTGEPVPVVLFVGRFMRFKRLQLLIEAHCEMRRTTGDRSVLVVAGGYPGEWEGEHPYDTVQRLGAQGVFFVGWRDHDELAALLGCSDVFAAPSVDEPFGLVYLEAMSAGVPPLATSTGGPLTFVNLDRSRPTGWLVPPDDPAATARALYEAVSDPSSRDARGRRAARFVRERYSWAVAASAFEDVYAAVVAEGEHAGGVQGVGRTRGVA